MKKHTCAKLFTVIWLTVSSVGGVIAAESSSAAEHETAAEHLLNKLGVFVGFTYEGEEYHETLGIEYVYRLTPSWSLGGIVERADREKSSTLIIAFAHWFPYKEGLYLGAGAGRKDPGDTRENTIRATIGYDFDLSGGWVIAPEFNLDFIENNENEPVFGVGIGKHF
jgi:hypothetical protein